MQYHHDHSKLAYSIKEACRASSLGRTTLYAHIKSGRLKTIKVGGRTLIPSAALLSLLSESAPDNDVETWGDSTQRGWRR